MIASWHPQTYSTLNKEAGINGDSYKYLSPLIRRYYKLSSSAAEPGILWTPMTKPLSAPSFRTLPANLQPEELGVSHFHINQRDILADMNILLPIQRFREPAAAGRSKGQVDFALWATRASPPI